MQEKLEKFLIFIGVIFYIFVFPHGIHGDGAARAKTLIHLLETGQWVDVSYPMLGALFATPLYFLGSLVKTHHWWLSRYNTFVFLTFLLAISRLLKNHLPQGTLRKFVLLLMAATMFSKHVTDFYGEVFTSCMIAFGLTCWVMKKDMAGFICLVLGVVNTPATLIGQAFAAIIWTLSMRRLRYLLVIVGAIFAIFLENWLRRGSIINFGYDLQGVMVAPKSIQPYSGLPGFSYPLFFGLISILFSFGKGLLFFLPSLLLFFYPLKENSSVTRPLLNLWFAFLFGLILLYAKFYAWSGGWFWGPRYLLFGSIPAALCLALFLDKSQKRVGELWALLALLLLSVWVSTNGVAFDLSNMAEPCFGPMEYVCLYVPEFSALWRPFVAEKGIHGKQAAFIIYHMLVFICLSRGIFVELWSISKQQLRAARSYLLKRGPWKI